MFFLLLSIPLLMRFGNLSATAVSNMHLRDDINLSNVNQRHARLIGRDRAVFKYVAEGEEEASSDCILLKINSLKSVSYLKGWADLWAAFNNYLHEQRALSISFNAFIEQNKLNIEKFSRDLRKNGILINKSVSEETFEKLEPIDSGISTGEVSSTGGSTNTSMTDINLKTSGGKPATPAEFKSFRSRIPVPKSGFSPRTSTPCIKNARFPATPPVSPVSRTEKYSRRAEHPANNLSHFRMLKQKIEFVLKSLQTQKKRSTDEHTRRSSLSDDSTTDNSHRQNSDSNVSSRRLSLPTPINNNQNVAILYDHLESIKKALKSAIADFEGIIASLSG
ncbi:hypothetical protein VCUG_01372 [Vavraia culicis subsp. floridensis]|uniref:Uncharacterized protein n=1 Tax=Vavraia culicis (isolate floridensis) TaxID=948595 RepID=L2GTZ8_VAVCU|nr:uncharacterized protein VCUG_01372 [Vavraia culicis subsp. floridensis]ELA47099.1 hypothetical protein VCUG_01372 [Vavraia culicis subsp. floridensis]